MTHTYCMLHLVAGYYYHGCALLTARMRSEGYGSWSVCVCVCLSATILSLQATRWPKSDT